MIAIDTNVLAYAEGVNGETNRDAALSLLAALRPDSTIIPAQSLAELFNVLTRKAKRTAEQAHAAVVGWGDAFPIAETTADVILGAFNLARAHRFGVWDAVILSAAADSGCRVLLSEDLQAGFTWGRVTIVNPFHTPRDPLLDAYLAS